MAQTAGDFVMMIVPNSGAPPAKVHRSNIAEARRRGGVVVNPALLAAMNAAPTVGSIAGGTIGGIAGGTAGSVVPGAGTAAGGFAGRFGGGVLGGMAGKAAQELGYRAAGYGDAPGNFGEELQQQLVGNALGEVGGKFVSLAAKSRLAAAVPNAVKDAKKGIEFMLRERVPAGSVLGDIPSAVSRVGRATASKVGRVVRNVPVIGPALVEGGKEAHREILQLARDRNKLLLSAFRKGVRVPRQIVEDKLKEMIYKASRHLDDNEVKFLVRKLDAWRSRKLSMLDPREVQEVITVFNRKAQPYWNALKRGVIAPEETTANNAVYASELSDVLTNYLKNDKNFVASTFREFPKRYRRLTQGLSSAISGRQVINALESSGGREAARDPITVAAALAAPYMFEGSRKKMQDSPTARVAAAVGALALANPAALSRLAIATTDPMIRSAINAVSSRYISPEVLKFLGQRRQENKGR
jgi:hypothetical protein